MGSHVIILDAIRTIVQNLRISSRKCESESGLSSAQLFVLQKLKNRKALSLSELAEQTLTHQSSVSVVVARLCEKKLISRNPSKADARRLDLTLTELGRSTLRSAPRTAQEDISLALNAMSERKRGQLAELLQELSEKAGFSTAVPPLFFEDHPTKKRKSK